MFDFSFAELLLIVVVAVVFIGPKELPVVLRAVVTLIRAVRSLGHQAHEMFDELVKESGMKDVTDSLQKDVTLIKGDDGLMYESYSLDNFMLPKPTAERTSEKTVEIKATEADI